MSGKLWKIKAAQKLLNAKRINDPNFLEVSVHCEKVFEIKSFERPDLIVQNIAFSILGELRLMKLKAVTLRDSATEGAWEASIEEITRVPGSGDLFCTENKVV